MLQLLQAMILFSLSLLIFFPASQQFASAVDATGVWSNWGQWSACNVHDIARRTRFRECLHSSGETLRSSHCLGVSKRTRQCASCASSLLNQNARLSITLSGLHATKTSWCVTKLLSSDASKYAEISFQNFVQLTAIGTRGHAHGHIKKYKVRYSYEGRTWFSYTNTLGEEELRGNVNATSWNNNTLKPRLVAKYIRVYPTSFTTHACFNVELFGCEYNCGGLITDEATPLKSPLTSNQIDELNCLWRVEPKSATKLQLKFTYLRVFCEEGVLQVYDGRLPYNPSNDATLLEAFCGHSGKVSPQTFQGKALWLRYRSNTSAPGSGFQMVVNSFVLKTLNATAGKVLLPKTGFSNIYRYSWVIKAPRDNDTIELILDYFLSNNTQSVGGKCVSDAIIIHHSNRGETLITRYCDTNYPQAFNSTNGYLKIKYRSRSVHPNWKIGFSYKILGYPSASTTPVSKEGTFFTASQRQARTTSESPSGSTMNDTNLAASGRQERAESSSNIPIIVSCVLAFLIATVCVVAFVHYRRRRREYLKKHPYDCASRPMSHFGEEDGTPFINTNLLMWSDSKNAGKSENPVKKNHEKSKKSLPVVEVIVRENEPQRLSIIPPEMLKSSSEVSIGLPGNEGNNTGSLKVSDNFTEECMKLLNNNLSSALAGNIEKCNPEVNIETYKPKEKMDYLPGMQVETYGSLPEADRRSPEVDDISPEESLPEAETHTSETKGLI